MCSIIGVYSKHGQDVSPEAAQLLSSLKHRGPEAFGVKTSGEPETSVSLSGLSFPESPVYLGHCLFSTTGYLEQPVSIGDVTAAFNGQIYNYSDFGSFKSDAEFIADFFYGELQENSVASAAKNFMQQSVGEYAVALLHKNKLYAFRDFIGAKPLWFGENEKLFAFASEPGALKKIGIGFPAPLKPGRLLEVSARGLSVQKIFCLDDFRRTIPGNHSVSSLKNSFERAIFLQTRGLKKAAVLFSGGVDSSLVAKAVSEKAPGIKLFVAGTENSHDIVQAEAAAMQLGLPLQSIVLDESTIGSLSNGAERILGFFDRMQIGLAVPVLACAKEIRKQGFKVVFSGQGSDELFCGYNNYARVLEGRGYAAVEDEIWLSLGRMWERNFYRDDLMIASCSLELRLPLILAPFVKEAMAFPAREKIRGADDALRKHPIRKLASLCAVPHSVASRPKKALQYGSGSQKMVSKLFIGR